MARRRVMEAVRAALLVGALVGAGCGAIGFELGPRAVECLYEDARKGSQVSVAFAVTSGAHLDIDVEVTSPSGSVVYQSSREGEGKYVFAAEHDGTYKFCFSNKMSVVAHKAVRVVIDTGSIDDLQSLATKSNLDAVEQSIVSIAHMVRLVEFHQANYRQLHEQHLTTVAATNVQVRVWSMLECLSVFVVAGLQVLFIKRTFPATRASRIV
mmetsp:Transcript_3354/g.9236  ORF Transcript_3354/g.9236 Transcript_3354/m.9236 type:complete len:211 (+) Transcript_3354:1367-1999(+)